MRYHRLRLTILSALLTIRVHTLDAQEPTYVDLRRKEIAVGINACARARLARIKEMFPPGQRTAYTEKFMRQVAQILTLATGDHVHHDATLDTYLKEIADDLNQTLDHPVEQLLILVTKDHTPNASSLGNGIIVVHFGLFRFLENKDQLAFVLAHEIAHDYHEHIWLRLDTTAEILKQDEFRAGMRKVRSGSAIAREAGAEMVRETLYGQKRFSRLHEIEADSLAFVMMSKAGYRHSEARPILSMMDTYSTTDTSYHLSMRHFFGSPGYQFDTTKTNSIPASQTVSRVPVLFSVDSLSTHPSFADRVMLLDTYDLPAPEPGENATDSILHLQNRISSELTMVALSEVPVFGLFESLKMLTIEAPADSLHIAYAVSFLEKIMKIKETSSSNALLPNIYYMYYPADVQQLLMFCRFTPLKEFATLSLNFLNTYDSFLSAEHRTRIRTIAEKFAAGQPVNEMTYKEWREAKQQQREAKQQARDKKNGSDTDQEKQ